jgi:hypothetical protein
LYDRKIRCLGQKYDNFMWRGKVVDNTLSPC